MSDILARLDSISKVQDGFQIKLSKTHPICHKTLKTYLLADFKILSLYRQLKTDGISY